MAKVDVAPRSISLDIETVPNEQAELYFTNVKKYRAPSNYKDPEKIAEYVRECQVEDIGKAGLNWWTGQIIGVSLYRCTDKKSIYFYTGKKFSMNGSVHCKSEKHLLASLMEVLSSVSCQSHHIIGKNYVTFDKPFIVGRLLHHNIGFIDAFRSGFLRDVDEMFGWGNGGQKSSLNTYAFGMGIKLKDFDGSMVHEMWKSGRLKEIAEYCVHDSKIVGEMLDRYWRQYVSDRQK